jgi:tetratricopeptide (TPR) repeat protein
MFFPRLRRQAKWMFVFLALAFGIGFVAFGIGGTGGSGISDLLRNAGSASSGPSISDAQEKVDHGNLAAYKELTEAYRADGDQEAAIAAGEKYVKVRPKDYDFIRTLASDYEAKAARLRNEAAAVQSDLTATTGGTTFSLPQDSVLGRALGTGRIDRELTTAANTRLTELYSGIQTSYTRATRLYQQVAAVRNEDVLLQLLLAQSAYQAQLTPIALKAYARVIKLAPDSAEAQQARQQRQLLKLQSQAGRVPSG